MQTVRLRAARHLFRTLLVLDDNAFTVSESEQKRTERVESEAGRGRVRSNHDVRQRVLLALPSACARLELTVRRALSARPITTLPVIPPTSRFASLIASQTTVAVPTFTLESGLTLTDVPVAFKTWGKLNAAKDNCMVICHALTGSADVDDWCGPPFPPSPALAASACLHPIISPSLAHRPCTGTE